MGRRTNGLSRYYAYYMLPRLYLWRSGKLSRDNFTVEPDKRETSGKKQFIAGILRVAQFIKCSKNYRCTSKTAKKIIQVLKFILFTIIFRKFASFNDF